MPSPFPGMDPFLERHWADVHASLIIYARQQLQRQLPQGLVAGVEQYVALEVDEELVHYRPDVSVMRPFDDGGAQAAVATLALEEADEPVVLEEPKTQRRIRIEDTQGRLVTTIEFLSPSNKHSTADRDLFHHKQVEFLRRGVNLVEVDLLLSGIWTVFAEEDWVPPKCRYPYRICVVRATRHERPEFYPTSLQRPLPRIRIPLRPDDRDVVLRLQELIDTIWEDGAFARRINYEREPVVGLSAADETFMTQQLETHGITRLVRNDKEAK